MPPLRHGFIVDAATIALALTESAMPNFTDTSAPGSCIFCRLIAGEIPSARVFEDEQTVAFMDLGQVNPGHVLVATRRHAATLWDVTPEEAAAVMRTAHRIAAAARTVFDPAGLMLLQANGAVAGQTVAHFHLHVVPRHAQDGIDFTWPRKNPSTDQLADYARRLQAALFTTGSAS